MSDIFLSYSTKDQEKAEKLAAVLKQLWSVWGNAHVYNLHADPRVVIEERLAHTKSVVVLWSRAARKSFYVSETLKQAKPHLLLVVLIEKIELPARRGVTDALDLSDWDGSASHVELRRLIGVLDVITKTSLLPAAPPVSFEELSLTEIQESARLGIQEATSAQPEGGKQFSGVFISYRRNEAAAYAGRLYDRLAARFGREKVFIDNENVGWGEDFVEVITEAAESCAVMIVLISPRWSRGGQADVDDYVRLEVSKALGRKIRVMPILIQGASMPAPKDLPEDLAPLVRRNALALSDTRWERDVEDLIKSLENLLNN